MTDILIRREDTQKYKEKGHAKTVAEIGVMLEPSRYQGSADTSFSDF